MQKQFSSVKVTLRVAAFTQENRAKFIEKKDWVKKKLRTNLRLIYYDAFKSNPLRKSEGKNLRSQLVRLFYRGKMLANIKQRRELLHSSEKSENRST